MSRIDRTEPRGAHPVLRMLAARLGGALALLLVLSLLVFSLLYLAPGDLVKNLIGTRNVTAETVAAIRTQYRLDDPFAVQYLHWLGQALTGDLGTSIRYQAPVSDVIAARTGPTLALAGLAFLVSACIAVPLGALCAIRRGSPLDRAIVSFSVLGVSAPAFAASLLMLYVFSFTLGWFPLYGIGTGGIDSLWHLALPAVTLAIGVGAILTKLTRTAMLRELDQEYVVFARARGIAPRTVHRLAFRGAAIPIVTGAGLVLTSLVGGAIFVETVFALPGLGTLLQDSVIFKDVPVVQALTLLIAACIIAIAATADLVYLAFDPRLRGGRSAR